MFKTNLSLKTDQQLCDREDFFSRAMGASAIYSIAMLGMAHGTSELATDPSAIRDNAGEICLNISQNGHSSETLQQCTDRVAERATQAIPFRKYGPYGLILLSAAFTLTAVGSGRAVTNISNEIYSRHTPKNPNQALVVS